MEGFEVIHEAHENHLIKKMGINVWGKIQTERSRNDHIITDIRIKARDDIINVMIHLNRLTKQLIDKSEDNLDSIMPLYTHLQQAQIGNFAHYLLSDRKSTRLNSSHLVISYAVFCLKKKILINLFDAMPQFF